MADSGITILVVDDIPLMRTMLAKYLRSLGLRVFKEERGVSGIDVVEAENGREAFERLADVEIDMIFLDLMMPEMDGLTFLARKAQDPRYASIPVVVCSALGEKGTVDRANQLGAAAYIMKPFSLQAVEDKFRHALSLLEDIDHV